MITFLMQALKTKKMPETSVFITGPDGENPFFALLNSTKMLFEYTLTKRVLIFKSEPLLDARMAHRYCEENFNMGLASFSLEKRVNSYFLLILWTGPFINDMSKKNDSAFDFWWIGGKMDREGIWKWPNGDSVTDTFDAPGRVAYYGNYRHHLQYTSDQNCLTIDRRMVKSGKDQSPKNSLTLSPCIEKRPFICSGKISDFMELKNYV